MRRRRPVLRRAPTRVPSGPRRLTKRQKLALASHTTVLRKVPVKKTLVPKLQPAPSIGDQVKGAATGIVAGVLAPELGPLAGPVAGVVVGVVDTVVSDIGQALSNFGDESLTPAEQAVNTANVQRELALAAAVPDPTALQLQQIFAPAVLEKQVSGGLPKSLEP